MNATHNIDTSLTLFQTETVSLATQMRFLRPEVDITGYFYSVLYFISFCQPKPKNGNIYETVAMLGGPFEQCCARIRLAVS